MAFLGTIGSYIGSFFTADATAGAAAAGATDAAAGAGAAAGAASAGGAATTAAAAGGASAAAAGGGGGLASTIAEASAIASGASALYTLSQGPGRISIPPSPQPAAQTDTAVANAEQQEIARREAAGGLNATAGPLGQSGSILNPSTLSQKSLLGA